MNGSKTWLGKISLRVLCGCWGSLIGAVVRFGDVVAFMWLGLWFSRVLRADKLNLTSSTRQHPHDRAFS